jgi:hypothetical protein
MPFVLFFHVVCKISNFNMRVEKHLAQASSTELTLPNLSDAHLLPKFKSVDVARFFDRKWALLRFVFSRIISDCKKHQ